MCVGGGGGGSRKMGMAEIPSDPQTSWIVFCPATLSFPRAYYFFHISQPAKICLKNRYFGKKFHWLPLYFRSSLLSLHPKTYFSGGDKQIYVCRRRVRRLRCEHHGRPNLCTAKARGCMNMLYLGRHFLQVRIQVTSLQINKQEYNCLLALIFNIFFLIQGNWNYLV